MSVSPAGRTVPKTQNFWTTRELAKLRECYATAPRAELLEMFAPRPMYAITKVANQLGLRRKRDWRAVANNHRPVFTLS